MGTETKSQTTTAQKFQALILDIFFGIYFVVTLHRVFYYQVLLSLRKLPPVTVEIVLLYIGIGSILGLALFVLNVSPGKRIFRQLPDIPWKKAVAEHFLWIIGVLTIATGWVVTRVSILDFFSQEGLAGAKRIFSALLSPEWSILPQALLAIVETIYLALMATLFALPVAFILSFFTARNLMRQSPITLSIYTVLRVLVNFTRSIEPLIWAIIFTVWVGIGPFAGTLALMVHTIASLTKLYSEQIENVDPGPIEAIEATGAHPMQVIWFAVVPQIVLPFLSFTIYRWDINVRMATIIGLVGGGGIGTLLMQYQGLAQWHEVGLLVLIIAIVVWIMDYLSARIREALV